MKIYILGTDKNYKNVNCIDWLVPDYPNLADCDLLILNLQTLTPEILKKLIPNKIIELRNFIIEIISSNRKVFCLIDKEISTEYGRKNLTNYSLFPFEISIRDVQPSDLFSVLDTYFDSYFKHIKRWRFEIQVGEDIEIDGNNLRIHTKKIAINKSNIPISLEAILFSEDYTSHHKISHGSVIFLHQVTEGDSVQLLLDIIHGVEQYKATPPDWSSNYFVKGEKDIISELNKKEFELSETLEKTRHDKRTNESHFEKIKSILYPSATDSYLVESIAYVLNEMSIKAKIVEHNGYQDIEIDENLFFGIVEVKGLNGFANVDDLRQLQDWELETIYHADTEKKKSPKAIFIVNHYRNIEPAKRTEAYTKDAKRIGERGDGFCLMTTMDLFHLYNKFLEGTITKEKVLELIKETKGILSI